MQVAPDNLVTAAQNIATIGSDLKFAHSEAAVPMTNIASAGADEVSAAIAEAFAAHGQSFQQVTDQAIAFHDQFVQTLTGSANAYKSAETSNASVLSEAASILPAAAAPAEDNGWVTLIQLGALALSPFIVVALLGTLSTLLATYWAVQFLGTVLG
ncbi:PE family protein [Mycobacterium intermedium]|nr:PE family protein [Mycobacterium intermedium]MCV6966855.1 PE family protein [Mycobacterium intermedium]